MCDATPFLSRRAAPPCGTGHPRRGRQLPACGESIDGSLNCLSLACLACRTPDEVCHVGRQECQIMTDIATHRAIQGHQDWAKRRQEVLARHPGLVVDATPTPTPTRAAETHNSAAEHDPLQLNGRSIRQHELWRRFVVERKFDETQEDGHGSETASSPTRDLDAALAATAISSSRDTYADLTRRYFGPVYCPEEQTLRSDHSWNYVATGLQRLPADAIRNPYLEGRFSEYPKLLRLVELKRTLVDNCAAPPTYLCADLKDSTAAPPSSPNTSRFHLTTLVPVKYDVVLIDPPLASYGGFSWEAGVDQCRC